MNFELYIQTMSMHLLTNPYVLGYLAVMVLIWRAGTVVKHMAQDEKRRKARLD